MSDLETLGPLVWRRIVQPALDAGTVAGPELRLIWRPTFQLGAALEAQWALEDVAAFLRLHSRHQTAALDFMPGLFWADRYRETFQHLLPAIPTGVGRRGVTPLVAALIGDGSIRMAAEWLRVPSHRTPTLVRSARVAGSLGGMLCAALVVADEICEGLGLDYSDRRDVFPPGGLTDEEWQIVLGSTGGGGKSLEGLRGFAGLWVWAELSGGDPEAVLAGIGRRVQGWEGFLRRDLPYLASTLAAIARHRLEQEGLSHQLACQDPLNRTFDEVGLITTPVTRPRWAPRKGTPAARCLTDLRRAATELGEPLRRASYIEWAKMRSPADQRTSEGVAVRHFGSWAAACEQAGVRSGHDSFTHEDYEAALRLVANSTPLSSATYKVVAERDPRLPSCASVVMAYGSWSAACVAAGIEQSTTVSDQAMLEALSQAGRDVGYLSEAAYDKWRSDDPDHRTIPGHAFRYRFGTWTTALAKAEVISRGSSEDLRVSDEALLDGLQRAARVTDGALSQGAYDRVRKDGVVGSLPSLWTSIKRFGSWSEAKRRAGVR